MDQARVALTLRLAPEIPDVDVERVRRMAEVVAPDTLVDERAGQHLTGVAHEQLEEVRLGRRQLEAAPAAARVHRAQIEREVGETEHVRRLLVERTTQKRAQPGKQLL